MSSSKNRLAGDGRTDAYAVKADGMVISPMDHLYPNCPAIRREAQHAVGGGKIIKLLVSVDPFGTDLCGWCVRVFKSRALRSF